jgi:hypothetical protein
MEGMTRSGCKTYLVLRKRPGRPFLLITLSFFFAREEVVLVYSQATGIIVDIVFA